MNSTDRYWFVAHALAHLCHLLSEAETKRMHRLLELHPDWNEELGELGAAEEDGRAAKGHLPDSLLVRLHAARGALSNLENDVIDFHLSRCEECQRRLDALRHYRVSLGSLRTARRDGRWRLWLGGGALVAASIAGAMLLLRSPDPGPKLAYTVLRSPGSEMERQINTLQVERADDSFRILLPEPDEIPIEGSTRVSLAITRSGSPATVEKSGAYESLRHHVVPFEDRAALEDGDALEEWEIRIDWPEGSRKFRFWIERQ